MAFPAGDVTLRNATLPAADGTTRRVDIALAGGTIRSITNAGEASAGAAYDLDGGIVMPCFVDMHTHLDKGHIWPRKANPDGTWIGALNAVLEDREANWRAEDVERRMDFALRCAYAHGTAAIRTHLDSAPPQHGITWDVFTRMREKWRGRVELQACSIVGPDTCVDPAELDAVARVVKSAEGVLGGAVAVFDRAREAVFAAVEKAGELGLAIDLHIDETLDTEAMALRHFADAVIETGYKGAAVAGHCCALSAQEPALAALTIERVAEAGIAVVSLPLCNLYLMDRDPAGIATPIRRGPTLLKELRTAGVRVAIASDNTRDPFYAYGDLDCLEVLREGARIVHLDHPQSDAWTWAQAVGVWSAEICGFDYRARIEPGASADLVLFRARSWTELMARPQADRVVLRAGKAIDTTLPDYRELDDLMEVS